jgi:uncharacterized membrane protein (UPF0182 family)
MPLSITVQDQTLQGFRDPARDELKRALDAFAAEVVAEALRLEAGHNITSSQREVTAAMVAGAVISLKRGLGTPRKSWKSKLWHIGAAVASLLVGILYDPVSLQQPQNMFVFVIAIAAAIIFTTVTILKE